MSLAQHFYHSRISRRSPICRLQEIDGRVLRPILHHDSLLTEIVEPLLSGILGQTEKEAQGTSGDETFL